MSFLGLSIAKSTFSSRYEDGAYAIDGSVTSAGLAKLFDDTRGTISSKGTISGKKMVPQAFRADYTSGKKASMVDIRFANGAVTSTQVIPAPGKRDPKSWVPLGASDLASVLDPMAATVIHADSLDQVCGRTVKFYDGEMRADLTLTYASKGPISVPGYKGDTVTCRMGFEPVAGYRKGRKALELSEEPQPHDGDVCAARPNRRICADPRHGRHPDRHDHHQRAGGSKRYNRLGAIARRRETEWGAQH